MDNQLDVFIFCGEASGDLLGAELIEHLLCVNPHLKIGGVTGHKMNSYPIESLLSVEDFQVMGFIDVFKSLPRLISQFFVVRNHILSTHPKYVILVDYPGFNLRLAKSLKKNGCQSTIIQYVCPSVWAWKKNRLHTMKKYIDHVWTLFSFESFYLESYKIPHTFIGHPLEKKIPNTTKKRAENLLLIFPGSRKKELERNFTIQFEALLPFIDDYRIGISYLSQEDMEWMRSQIKTPSQNVFFFNEESKYKLMEEATLALATSGTITLELALFQVPTVVNYKLSVFDSFLDKYIFNISLHYYCIVNFVCLKKIFPEFYSHKLRSEDLYNEIASLLSNKELLEEISMSTKQLRTGIEKKINFLPIIKL